MKLTKRFGSLVLAGCLALSALPALAVDADADGTGSAGAGIGEEITLQSEQDQKAYALAADGYLPTGATVNTESGTAKDSYTSSYSYEFDANGNITKETFYLNGEAYSIYTYTYNAAGEVTLFEYTDGSGRPYGRTEYTWQEDGSCVEKDTDYDWNTTESGVIAGYETTEYDKDGNITKVTYEGAKGTENTLYDSVTTYTYEYDGGKLVKETEDCVGLISSTSVTTYSYDANGKLLKEVTEDEDEASTVEYTYDDAGNITTAKYSEVNKDSGVTESAYTYVYTYDSNGNVLTMDGESSYNYSGNTTTTYSRYVYTYDSAGNRITEAYYSGASADAKELVTQSTYTYEKISVLMDPSQKFTDVASSEWYYDAVYWAVNKGITLGTSDTTFAPDEGCTRAQIVTFLWRSAGSPAPTTTDNPFSDVSSSDWYYDAVLWAVENEITAGTSATTFSPNDTCIRSQAMTFIWRANDKPAAGDSNPFTDIDSGKWYTDAVLWAVANGITKGTSDTTFGPNDTCTRSQIVTFLYRAA